MIQKMLMLIKFQTEVDDTSKNQHPKKDTTSHVPQADHVSDDDTFKILHPMEDVISPPHLAYHVPIQEDVVDEVSRPTEEEIDEVSKLTEEATMNKDESTTVQDNLVKNNVLESTTSIFISSGTEAEIATIIFHIRTPIYTKPLKAVTQEEFEEVVFDSSKSSEIIGKEIILQVDSTTPAPCKRNPSKFSHSSYLAKFGSCEKVKDKMKSIVCQKFSFEGFEIYYQPPSDLMEEYRVWIAKDLLKHELTTH